MSLSKREDIYSKAIKLADIKPNQIYSTQIDESLEVAIVKTENGYAVFRNICPHMGARLNEGKICNHQKKNAIQCPWHGYEYDASSGAFIRNPLDPSWQKVKQTLKSYNPQNTPNYHLKPLGFLIVGDQLFIKRSASPMQASPSTEVHPS